MYILIQADMIEQRERVSTFKVTNGLGDPETKFYAGTFRFYLKRCFGGDLDNLAKVLLDNIVEKGIITGDQNVVEIHLYKYKADKDSIQVEIGSLVGEAS